ncbi:MAG: thiamine phosphate synthase, partial [Vulcanimicrobiaceae bacterium]
MTDRETRARGLHGIYAILDDREDGAETLVRAVLKGGARIVQYRAKRGIDLTRARNMLAAARECGALFIVNDDWRAAETLDADGVHLGPEDAR